MKIWAEKVTCMGNKNACCKDDVVKTNAVQILRQAAIEDVKSL